jgi:hypothetical protein
MIPSSLLSLEEIQHQMGEARTIQRNDAKQPSVSEVQGNATSDGRSQNYPRNDPKQPSVSGGENVLGVYVIRSQADALVCRLLFLMSKEMQHQMGEARTIKKNDAKQPSVSGGNATSDGRSQNYPKK